MLPSTRRLMNGKNGIYGVRLRMRMDGGSAGERNKTEQKIINLPTQTRNGEMTNSNEEKLAARSVWKYICIQRVVDPLKSNQMNEAYSGRDSARHQKTKAKRAKGEEKKTFSMIKLFALTLRSIGLKVLLLLTPAANRDFEARLIQATNVRP